MKVCCLDLELNQPSGKIIQIGYVIADIRSDRIFLERSLIVNPQEPLGFLADKQRTITDLTGITQEQVDNGLTLEQAYETLMNDVKRLNCSTTCVQWGDGAGDHKGDHDAIRQELGYAWVEFVFRPRSWDVKSFYQIYRAFKGNGVAAGLGKSMAACGLEFQGREHDALDDAKNTLTIFKYLGNKMHLFDQIKKLTK